MDAAHHRLRRSLGEGSRRARLVARASRSCSATGSAGAPGRRSIFTSGQRQRAKSCARAGKQRARKDAASRASRATTCCASTPRGPTRCSARRTWSSRRSIRSSTRLTTPEQEAAVEAYCDKAAAQERPATAPKLAKTKTGVFTGSLCDQSRQRRADADLDRRLCAHQLRHRRDHGRAGARRARFRVRQAVRHCRSSPSSIRAKPTDVDRDASARRARRCFAATARRSTRGEYDGLDDGRVQSRRSPPISPTAGVGREAVNYKLRDWLFSRQRFWGEPFPILHELDADGKPTGVLARR